MQYRPEAMDDKQSRRAPLDERSQLFTHMEEVLVQDKHPHHCSQWNLQIGHRIVISVNYSRTKRQIVSSVLSQFPEES